MSSYKDVLSIYKNLDQAIASFQSATGLYFLSGCWACCIDGHVEATRGGRYFNQAKRL
jgi:hypothetical protein